jgi:hypothetical protein
MTREARGGGQGLVISAEMMQSAGPQARPLCGHPSPLLRRQRREEVRGPKNPAVCPGTSVN